MFTFSLRYKLVLSVVLIEVIMLTVMVVNNVRTNTATMRDRMMARARTTVELFATTSTNALLTMDLGSLQEYVNQVSGGEDVVYAVVETPEGIIIAHTDKKRVGMRGTFAEDVDFLKVKDNVFDVSYPVIIAEKLIGRVWIGFSPESAITAIHKIRNQGILIAGAEIMISIIASLFVGIFLTNSLKKLVSATKDMSEGDFGARVRIKSRDEIGELGYVFNEMAEGLKQRTEEMQVAYNKLKDAQEQIIQSEKMASLGRFVAGIAHEINNPLDGIENCVNSILKEPDNKKQLIEYLNLVLESFEKVETIIRQLKGYSHGYPLHRTRVLVREVLEDSIYSLKELFADANIEIKRTYEDHYDAVFGDNVYIKQALVNIMMNSIDAMPKGGTMDIFTKKDNGFIQVGFKDNGVGISDVNLKRVFEPFFTTKEVGKGTGLGLSVSHGIIEKHGGKIAIESAEGLGTTIIVDLPVEEGQRDAA
ncbi:MAG: HAMP domain-containing protein [Deltaproteobacteria bacterium]|nr:HAMP domain-containing protein [Deltaproteobacteria bacterium]